MPSPQILRRRIKSIQSTKQITKAMELVAASKMRRAQNQTLQSRPYAADGFTLVKNLSSRIDRSSHPLLSSRQTSNILLIVVTSDRGLAGAYNTLLLREVIKFIQQAKNQIVYIITIGRKALDVLRKIDGLNIVASYIEFPPHPMIQDVAPITKSAIDGFSETKYDSVRIAYTHFHSTLKQEPRLEELLPLTNRLSDEGLAASKDSVSNDQPLVSQMQNYKIEPNPDVVFDFILPRMIETQIYQRILEAIASEQSARMVAMKNASDNAGEIIGDLQLTYNAARQSKITQELLEITSASNM